MSRPSAAEAERRGVLIEPVGPYYADNKAPTNIFRLGVTSLPLDRIRQGIEVLADLMRDLPGTPGPFRRPPRPGSRERRSGRRCPARCCCARPSTATPAPSSCCRTAGWSPGRLRQRGLRRRALVGRGRLLATPVEPLVLRRNLEPDDHDRRRPHRLVRRGRPPGRRRGDPARGRGLSFGARFHLTGVVVENWLHRQVATGAM